MSNNILVSPPHWCKYAIPSVRGWCDPKTGELLIAVRGIKFEQVKVVEVGEKAEIPALLKPQVQIGVPSTKDPIVSSTAATTNETAEVAEIVAEAKDVVEVVEAPVEKKKTAAKKTTAKKTTTRKTTKKATAAKE